MKRYILAAICLSLSSSPVFSAQNSQSNYISDQLTVFVHTGPTRNYRITDTVVSGSEITILQRSEDGDFSQIRYDENKTGWIETQYIQQGASLAQRLKTAETELTELKSQLESKQANLSDQQSEKQMLESQLRRNQETTQELQQKLEKTQSQLTSLQLSETESLEKAKMDWLVRGGLLSIGSLILGYILALMPRRKKRQSEWA
ncbi:TIGR04211 family SH3 domain-containing protein [Catenovulum sp. 2E275]|uniref:TIGR04211 family SH3 domain-containing protein n=1 Tax=Catenovulum sp. 2E275 TaxID=2980497 RepID=UPI0021CEA09D|nr:TIGR04211 family SH3 domain-containing protein [Catenovulum sp. 2E275]MCU4674318.1 TIGR04211 family SH3 domain-containing protein [Catenovulum sp. 2E275]